MLRYHMAVVTRDNALKREVKRVTTATGSTADFIGDPSGLDPKREVHLAIYDARTGDPPKLFTDKVPKDASIQYVLEGDRLVDKIQYLKDERVTSLLCHDARFDDDEFIASATKALRGDVFGLQKYFPWGVTTFTMQIKSYEHKTRAIEVLLRYAKLAGVRGPVRDRIQLVCDELMMNALYHAPVDDNGKEMFAGKTLKELAQMKEVPAIEVQYGCSGRYFGVSVRDGGGSLTRERALDYLMRAKSGAAHIEIKAGGAGLGLISVLSSVSKLIFNLDPGYSTEVIAIFDMELFAKGKVGARSLHVFTQAPVEEDEEEPADEGADGAGKALTPRKGNGGKWVLAAILLAIVTGMGTAYIMRRGDKAAAAEHASQAQVAPHVTVVVTPSHAKATIKVNGEEVVAGAPVDVARGQEVEIQVTAPHYHPYNERIAAAELADNNRIHVALAPSRSGRHR